MKKYYLHNGTEQQGPFDIDELKTKSINKSTPIWYDGLPDWTTADKIEALKGIWETTLPPPFTQQQKTPPPIQKPITKVENIQQPKKRNTLTVTIIVIVILLVGGLAIMISNNPNAIPEFKLQINTPKPVVISSRANDSNSRLFKERTTVYATVQNQGGDGNVLVTFHVFQDGNDYDRTKSVHLSANESTDLDVTFDEVTRIGGDITYQVETRAE